MEGKISLLPPGESNIREIKLYKAALKEISKGRGAFKMDPLEHAHSCIDDMKEIAEKALRLEYVPECDEN